MASERTWVLVADGSRARILQKDEGGRKQLRTVEGMTFAHDLPKTSEVVRDRLPRTFESVGDTRHAVATEVDPHREEKRKFANELADALDAELVKKSFDRLVVVAPAQMLGDLRSALSSGRARKDDRGRGLGPHQGSGRRDRLAPKNFTI